MAHNNPVVDAIAGARWFSRLVIMTCLNKRNNLSRPTAIVCMRRDLNDGISRNLNVADADAFRRGKPLHTAGDRGMQPQCLVNACLKVG